MIAKDLPSDLQYWKGITMKTHVILLIFQIHSKVLFPFIFYNQWLGQVNSFHKSLKVVIKERLLS